MKVGVLGPLEVSEGGQTVEVPGAKQRALIARLALSAGEPVAADVLIDLLWGDELPGDAANALQARISRARRLLGRDKLTSSGAGYTLHVSRDDVDALAFARWAGEGRALLEGGSARAAADRLKEALALWRGTALADVGFEGYFQLESDRLEELRISTVEDRVEADLTLGRHIELAGELPGLVERHPLRERLRGQLMLALYRAGRQAEALAAFRHGREVLADELGLDPGPELQALEVAILQQDPALAAPAAATSAPAPVAAAPNRIRRPLSTFVGRQNEVARLHTSIDDHRLVTLTGPGGTGKTRLAVEVAAARQESGAAGAAGTGDVWLVELAGIARPELVDEALASSVTVRDRAIEDATGGDAISRVVAYLGDRSALLVLDNCEHVIGATALAAERLLHEAPGLRIMATSREPLGVPGEVQWPVPPLPADDAARLFVDRASAVRADLQFSTGTGTADGDAGDNGTEADAENNAADPVAEICARLDGLPLAVELAAARVKLLRVEQIASRLTDRFRLLTDGNRVALPRQQTLRALVDWSYELLFEDERRVFCLLSVFAGPFCLDDAEDLCERAGVDRHDVVDLLGRLVDKSLVQVDLAPAGGGQGGYRLLETLRQYGRERLDEDGWLAAARAWHAEVFTALAATAGPDLLTGAQLRWIDRLFSVHDNLKTALEWAVETGEADVALDLVTNLTWFWFVRGLWSEGAASVVRALGVDPDGTGGSAPAKRAKAWVWRCFWAHETDVNLDVALDAAERARAIATELSDKDLLAWAGIQYGRTLLQQGNRPEAAEALRQSLPRLDSYWSSRCRYLLAMTALADGQLDDAESYATDSLAGFREVGEGWGVLVGLIGLAAVLEARGRHADAVALYQEALKPAADLDFHLADAHIRVRLAAALGSLGDTDEAETWVHQCLSDGRKAGDAHLIGIAALLLGRLRRRDGDLDAAGPLLDESLINLRTMGSPVAVAVLHEQGYLAEQQGDLDKARRLHLEALGDDALSQAATLEGLAAIAVAAGRPRLAATLLGAADAAREAAGAPLTGADAHDVVRTAHAARTTLGPHLYTDTFAAARQLPPPDALAQAELSE